MRVAFLWIFLKQANIAIPMRSTSKSIHTNQKPYFAAKAFAFFFGISMLFCVMAASDGTWFLYAKEILSGKKIYADLHMTAQPIFPLINCIQIALLGDSLVSQKLAFIFFLSLYIHALSLLTSIASESGTRRALIFTALFFTSIHFEAFRFDDYHAVANTCVLYLIYLGYRLQTNKPAPSLLLAIGALCAVTFLTRINQGLSVTASISLLILLGHAPLTTKARQYALIVSSGLTMLLISLYAADTYLSEWFTSTIKQASSAKGGAMLFTYPLQIPLISTIHIIRNSAAGFIEPLASFVGLFIITALKRNETVTKKRTFILVLSLFCLISTFIRSDLILETAPFMVLLAYFMFAGLLIPIFSNNPYHLFAITEKSEYKLFAFPFFLYFFSSLSSGGHFLGLYFELSTLLLVVIIVYGKELLDNDVLFTSLLILLAVTGISYRFHNPYSWHTYKTSSMYSKSLILMDDQNHLGPHLIDKKLHDFILPVCMTIKNNPGSLLSLPFSFPNYYCNVPLWKSYVQTFFDTTPPSVINDLINSLKESPPKYIFYQRQLDNLRLHEKTFNSGKPLAHRELDEFLMQHVNSGEWSIVYRSSYSPPSDWMLIRTR